ncbi:hypothetical protein ACS0TY_036329 [Phlomoides rotata]
MADSGGFFSIYIYHGGKVVVDDGVLIYCGSNVTHRHGLDADRFGYFDLEEEVKQLGYTSWDGLFYKVPKSKTDLKRISDDVGVMDMIKLSNYGQSSIIVYVDNGKKEDVRHSNPVGAADANEGGRDMVVYANEGGIVGADEEFASEGSDTDEDYMPIDMSESEDGLSDQYLETDDEEYIMARHNRAITKVEQSWI